MQVNIYKVGPNMQPRLQLGDQTSGRACSSVAQLGGIMGALSREPFPSPCGRLLCAASVGRLQEQVAARAGNKGKRAWGEPIRLGNF